MKLWLGCPIFTWLAPCPHYSKYWQYLSRTTLGASVPLSDLGRNKTKQKDSCWNHLNRWADDGLSCRTFWGFQGFTVRNANLTSDISLQILALFYHASISGQAHTLLFPSLLNQDSSAYSNSPGKYKWREQHVVYIIITAMGLTLTVYFIREKHAELIHRFVSLCSWVMEHKEVKEKCP